MTELRAPLVEQMQRLATDIAIERHGDPHVAFVVLCYPDREPAIIVVVPGVSPRDLNRLGSGTKTTEPKKQVPFPGAEFVEAVRAMGDAHFAMRVRLEDETVGASIGRQVQREWERRRMAPVEAALEKAEDERKRPKVCANCKRRFTVRGYAMHLARSQWCRSAAEARST